jgi:geranylgeranyl pyrophosphate synthase
VAGIQTQSQDQEILPRAVLNASAAADHKQIPPTRDMRGIIRRECWSAAAELDQQAGLTPQILETTSEQILGKLALPAAYLGWTMVVLASEFWRKQVAAVPHARRLLLLPPDYEKATCPALADLSETARGLGLSIATTESSTTIMQLLLGGGIDAIVGVANLDTLEKSLDKILLVGIPALAVPLLSNDDQAPQLDADWVQDMLHLGPAVAAPRVTPYRALMQAARDLFEPAELARLLPRQRTGPSLAEVNGAGAAGLDPLAATETIAHDFLSLGGKYARPFITLAAYDALTRSDDSGIANLPDAVRRVAISIETFHKASLVHDDIEDSDDFRYGRPALHKAHGLPTAINIGDYMIGLGYSLVSREAGSLGAVVVGDILQILADAHIRLSEGQGAELLWRDARDKQLSPQDALAIYALKTSPAFEAALLSGLRCAGNVENLTEPLGLFCQHLGIAFQILNDLKDWQGDNDNKLGAGLDTLGGRPTVLWALALESLAPELRSELLQLASSNTTSREKIQRVRELYQAADVFDKAAGLVRKHQAHAESIARQISPVRLSELLQYLVEVVLDRSASLPAG